MGVLLTVRAACAAGETSAQPVPMTAPEPTGLDRYLARPEPAYAWSQFPSTRSGETDLGLTSQIWQGHTWRHTLQIFTPHPYPGTKLQENAAILWLQGGPTAPGGSGLDQYTANTTGAYVVDLSDVPNQPLNGLTENALVAYSFARYFQTGDETWPLLLPMTKSAVAAMNALGEWSAKAGKPRISRFIIAGASKRGWTTYLVAEHDRRVVGSMPFVYNFLDIPAQLALQQTEWGQVSDQMQDFVKNGLLTQLDTAAGHDLLNSVDPWNYRDNLTTPRLMVVATNDRYWPPDALKIYLGGLTGRTDLLIVPNVGHSLGDEFAPVLQSAALWANGVLNGVAPPALTLTSSGGSNLHLHAGSPLSGPVRIWYAASTGTDFRAARWLSLTLSPSGAAPATGGPATDFAGNLPASATGNVLAFAQVSIGDQRWQLSSNLIQITP